VWSRHLITYDKEKGRVIQKKMAMGLTKCALPGIATTFFLAVERTDDFPGTKVIAK